MSNYKKFYLLYVLGAIFISFYPIYMLAKVITEFMSQGSIDIFNYPKYIIPYSPIAIAVIFSISLIPLAIKLFKKYALPLISVLAIAVFFICEFALENIVVIDGVHIVTKIANYQMYSCYVTKNSILSAGDILVGNYNPSFKIHFYIISIIIILAVTNVMYGFSKMIKENNFSKKRPLVAQGISIGVFIGLCILACFTAFFRSGPLFVSPISAFLMSLFFITMGVTSGIYIGSFFYFKSKCLSITLPTIISLLMTIVMYVGELILLDGNVYRYGIGFTFEPLGFAFNSLLGIPYTIIDVYIPFAIIDLVVILLSGIITYITMLKLKGKAKD